MLSLSSQNENMPPSKSILKLEVCCYINIYLLIFMYGVEILTYIQIVSDRGEVQKIC
jgi:hypothetical protein